MIGNFINVKCANFSYKHRFSSYVLALLKNSYEKFIRKTLMKLTPRHPLISGFHLIATVSKNYIKGPTLVLKLL